MTPPTLHLASGNLTAHALGRLVVVTDHGGRLLAVGVYRRRQRHPDRRHRPELTLSTVYDRSPTMILRATWTGPVPHVGDYLMSQYRARSAYRVVAIRTGNEVTWDSERRAERTHLRLEVLRCELPVPDGAVIHPWKWDARGKNTGVRP